LTIRIEDKKDSPTLIFIQDEMTIYNVLEHKDKLYPYLKNEHGLQVDLSNVSEIDSAGMQLLIFLKYQSDIEKKEITFIEHSESVMEVINIFNFSSFFDVPVTSSVN
jgi:anti-sigma B factor antagonist